MRGFTWSLMLIYLSVTLLWISNSSYLFSQWGVAVWLLSTVSGFLIYKQVKENRILKKLVMYSTSFMVFLLIVTGLIHIAVTSMP
ncbi:hypothetical protein [Halobacillus andaensis]|uniref:hypothetical protein n=1 Tax=Halobacillus andaensis TaxID=1176239 RepID=UPI003D748EFB